MRIEQTQVSIRAINACCSCKASFSMPVAPAAGSAWPTFALPLPRPTLGAIRQSASELLTRAIRPQSDRQAPCQYHEPQRMTDQTPPYTHPPMMHAVSPAEPDHSAPPPPIDHPDAPRYHERAVMPPHPHAAETRRSTPRHARSRQHARQRCGNGRSPTSCPQWPCLLTLSGRRSC